MTDIDSGRDLAKRVLASRRGLLCGAAVLGAAGALAACGTAEPQSSGSEGSEAEETGGSEENNDGGTSQALATTDEVPVGGGIVAGETVIVQPTADEFLAFSALCPHQGTIVNAPDEAGTIVCPNHGSEFDMEGELLQGPAESGLTEVEITVEEGQILPA